MIGAIKMKSRAPNEQKDLLSKDKFIDNYTAKSIINKLDVI